jgi:hypothetical protein
MPNIFAAASRAVVVALTCPKCGEVQARALEPDDKERLCRKCGALLPTEKPEADAKKS